MNYDSISPIDGRYRPEAQAMARYFSEGALTKERVKVEISYLRLLMNLRIAPRARLPMMDVDLGEIEDLEARLGHDVKAIEVYIRKRLESSGSAQLAPYVHLGLTSEDTNSLAFATLLKSALAEVLLPAYSSLATELASLADREAATAMLARTHGRPAVPTTFGKEMAVYAYRFAERVYRLKGMTPMAKFSGAVGTYASFLTMRELEWRKLLSDFVAKFGVEAAPYSTQVTPGERLSDILHAVININQLTSALARDLWLYQTLDYVHFLRPGKVSSSTMPQKVNPVDLENAEGQVDISNSLLVMIAYRMQQTRMQRDLSDSVVRRMIGQGLSHSLVACKRMAGSLKGMKVERAAMSNDLERHPEVLAEREQILKRLGGDARGYEAVKESVDRGEFVGKEDPSIYLGEAVKLARESPSKVRRLLSSPGK